MQLEKGNTTVQRLTPAKFTTAHVKGKIFCLLFRSS